MLDYKISMSLLSLNLSLPALLKETYDTNPIGTIVKAYQQQQAQLEINNSNNNKSVSASAPAPSASVNPVPSSNKEQQQQQPSLNTPIPLKRVSSSSSAMDNENPHKKLKSSDEQAEKNKIDNMTTPRRANTVDGKPQTTTGSYKPPQQYNQQSYNNYQNQNQSVPLHPSSSSVPLSSQNSDRKPPQTTASAPPSLSLPKENSSLQSLPSKTPTTTGTPAPTTTPGSSKYTNPSTTTPASARAPVTQGIISP
jgi:hypothetical protein